MTFNGVSKLITFIFELFSQPLKLKVCSLLASSTTTSFPFKTRPLSPLGLGTYSNLVASIGCLKVTVNGFSKLNAPYGVCHNELGLLSNANHGESWGSETASMDSISLVSGVVRLISRFSFANCTFSINCFASGIEISSAASDKLKIASL